MPNNSKPLSSASSRAALAYSALPAANNGPRLAAVISDNTATGPTARLGLDPNNA